MATFTKQSQVDKLISKFNSKMKKAERNLENAKSNLRTLKGIKQDLKRTSKVVTNFKFK